ncbi:ubiquitin-like protein ATG12 [Rhincodon typus]|uniref:ubiquitin-like protein ATG12 n=1 Tax=Rhincodon typus TaxID=259920 RepID=UPI00202FC722|nr:ubiquitin-like protein ATG12 [Rhincodon typus]
MADTETDGAAGAAVTGDGDDTPTGDGSPPPVQLTAEEAPEEPKKKIDVLLKAVGDTPIMKKKKWAVERSRTVQGLGQFIKKFLKVEADEQLVSGTGREGGSVGLDYGARVPP